MTVLARSASSIPCVAADASPVSTGPIPRWGGEAEPTRTIPISDPELRAAYMHARDRWESWAERHQPSLLQGQLDLTAEIAHADRQRDGHLSAVPPAPPKEKT